MRTFLKRLALGLIGLMITAIALAVLIILVVNPGSGPNVRDPGYIKVESEQFLIDSSRRLFPGDIYTLVELKGPAGPEKDWVLLTIARYNPIWEPGTGAGGLIAIGRLEKTDWRFQLPTDRDFDSWLTQLPEVLLSSKLKKSFQTAFSYPEELSSAIPLLPSTPQPFNQEVALYLPYPEKRDYKITTLPGDGGHLKKWNAYDAIDFDMSLGTDVTASAGGEIIAIRDDSQLGDCSEKYKDDANYVVIKIAPNQTIRYMHLDYQSVTKSGLKLHSKVATGQVIGKAGTSGWACGAHLHIVREKLCGSRVCGSLPLNFEEFEPDDPQYDEEYVSKNKSPKDWKALEEKQRREQERKEIEQITEAVARFHTIYKCSRVKSCDESDLISNWVTQGLFQELFPTSCFFCSPKLEETTQTLNELLPFSPPTTEQIKVQAKEIWESFDGSNKLIHYTFVSHFLVKEGGVWKVDGWEIECGYVLDEEGEVFHEENLEGCLWQPPETIEESSSESKP